MVLLILYRLVIKDSGNKLCVEMLEWLMYSGILEVSNAMENTSIVY